MNKSFVKLSPDGGEGVSLAQLEATADSAAADFLTMVGGLPGGPLAGQQPPAAAPAPAPAPAVPPTPVAAAQPPSPPAPAATPAAVEPPAAPVAAAATPPTPEVPADPLASFTGDLSGVLDGLWKAPEPDVMPAAVGGISTNLAATLGARNEDEAVAVVSQFRSELEKLRQENAQLRTAQAQAANPVPEKTHKMLRDGVAQRLASKNMDKATAAALADSFASSIASPEGRNALRELLGVPEQAQLPEELQEAAQEIRARRASEEVKGEMDRVRPHFEQATVAYCGKVKTEFGLPDRYLARAVEAAVNDVNSVAYHVRFEKGERFDGLAGARVYAKALATRLGEQLGEFRFAREVAQPASPQTQPGAGNGVARMGVPGPSPSVAAANGVNPVKPGVDSRYILEAQLESLSADVLQAFGN